MLATKMSQIVVESDNQKSYYSSSCSEDADLFITARKGKLIHTIGNKLINSQDQVD